EPRQALDTEGEVELVLFLELLLLTFVQDAIGEALRVLRREHLELVELREAAADANLRVGPARDVQVRRATVHPKLQKIGPVGGHRASRRKKPCLRQGNSEDFLDRRSSFNDLHKAGLPQ